MGAAWAWYMLSPNWTPYLPAGAKPLEYSRILQTGPSGRPLLKKVAVIVAAGEFDTQYCSNGVPDAASAGSPFAKGDCSSDNGSSLEQFSRICDGMRARGITIYTMAMMMPEGATKSALRSCATSADHSYQPENGSETLQSFRTIGLHIAEMQFTN